MPLHVHGNDGTVGDGLVALGAPGGEELLVVLTAVDLAVALIEREAGQRLLAGAFAAEAILVPGHAPGGDGSLEDWLLAAGAGVSVALLVALGAHRLAVLDVKGGIVDLLLAVAAQEVLRMPGLAQRGDHALGDGPLALVAHDFFRHLGLLWVDLCLEGSKRVEDPSFRFQTHLANFSSSWECVAPRISLFLIFIWANQQTKTIKQQKGWIDGIKTYSFFLGFIGNFDDLFLYKYRKRNE